MQTLGVSGIALKKGDSGFFSFCEGESIFFLFKIVVKLDQVIGDTESVRNMLWLVSGSIVSKESVVSIKTAEILVISRKYLEVLAL